MLCLLIPANSIHNEKLYCMSSLYIYSPVNIQVTAYIPSKDLSELEAFVWYLYVPYTRENRCSIRHNMREQSSYSALAKGAPIRRLSGILVGKL